MNDITTYAIQSVEVVYVQNFFVVCATDYSGVQWHHRVGLTDQNKANVLKERVDVAGQINLAHWTKYEASTTCTACHGSGLYMTKRGPIMCVRCVGKGVMTSTDRARTGNYFTYNDRNGYLARR